MGNHGLREFHLAGLALVCLWAGAGLCSAQRNWHVSPSGADPGNECQDSNAPCATISYALGRIATNPVAEGDALYLAPGVFTESGLLADRNLNWIGAGADSTFVQGADDVFSATSRVLQIGLGAEVRISGVTIRHGRTRDGSDDPDFGAAGGDGGGILVNGTLTLVDAWVVSNLTGRGGAGLQGGSGGDGAGIFTAGLLRMSNVVVAYTRAGDGGAGTNAGGRGGNGWGVHNSGVLDIHFTTLHHNQGGDGGDAGQDGGAAGNGALWNSGAALFASSTISDNSGGAFGSGTNGSDGAVSSGGAWWNAAAGTGTLAHATLADNGAGSARGVHNAGGLLAFDHVIVSHDSSGVLTLLGPTLMENVTGATVTGAVGQLITGVEPQLGALAEFGGATPVRRLKPLSPAVNAGNPGIPSPPSTDQRGAPRVQGGRIDLGAYELQPATLYVAEGGVDGTNECRDIAAACATLTQAVPQALPGDTIQIATGTLVEAGVVLDRSITIAGAGPLHTIWQAAAAPESATNRLLAVVSGVTSTVRDLTFRHGSAPDGTGSADGGNGGAIRNLGGLNLLRCEFIANRAGDGGSVGGVGGLGGAIYNNGALVVDECRFISNSAGTGGSGDGPGGSGGALFNDNSLTIRRTSILSNSAGNGGGNGNGGSGGGLFNGGIARIETSTLAWNRAGDALGTGVGGFGGGLFNEDILGATNLTISGNITGPGGRGGGLRNEASLSLYHATIASNRAVSPSASGGGLSITGLGTRRSHVVVSDNDADGLGPDIDGEINSLGYNLISDTNALILSGNPTGNLLGVSALLDPLADNGGPTWTHLPANASPAREAGDPAFTPPPATDQRGQPRRIGPRIDLGAIEPALADSDGDSLPDYWELLYGLDPHDPGLTNVLAGASGDPDGDHVDNASEYVAGTSPADPTDFLQVVSVELVDEEILLRYRSNLDRLYSLQTATPSMPLVWTNVVALADLPGTGGTDTVSTVANPLQALYRLGVRLP